MTRTSRATVAVFLATAFLSAGCGARWAYKQGVAEGRKGNWDLAVARLTKAQQKDPDNISYRIELENARMKASQQHYAEAKKHLAADELEKAAEELQIAANYDPANKSAADDLSLVKERIKKRDAEKARLTDFEGMKTREGRRLPLPVLSPRSTAPIHMNFADQSLQTILEALGKVAAVNVLFDADYRDKKTKVNLQGVTFQQALDQIAFSHRLFYKVIDSNTIIVVQDSQAKRRVYEDLLLRTFYLQNVETKEVEAILKTAMGPQAKVLSNASVNAITVIGTVDQLALAERVIGANDKAKGEVMVEVEILEVQRNKLKDYGITLSNYTAGATLSPTGNEQEVGGLSSIRAHLLSSLNLSDFIVRLPTTVFARFIQNEDSVRILAAPRLRAAEGKKTALKMGTEVPVPVTTFTAANTGTSSTFAPATSFQYRNVGINLELTPKVSASGDIALEIGAEFSLLGGNTDVGGTSLPTFLTRTVNGILRVRDGETTLIGGLLSDRDSESFAGALGMKSIPILNNILGRNLKQRDQIEILVSITPHLVRGPKILEEDLRPIMIGTQELTRVEGARPPLFGEPEPAVSPAPEASPSAQGPSMGRPPGTVSPGQPAAGEQPTPAVTPQPPQAFPTPLPPTSTEPVPEATPPPAPGSPPPAPPASASLSPPESTVRVGETTALSVVLMNAQGLTAVDITISFDAAVLEAVDVGPGPLMTLDGAAVGSERNLEAGRLRARLTRATPTAGSGVVAVLSFRGTGPGTTVVAFDALTVTLSNGTVAGSSLAGPVRITVTPGGVSQ